MTEDNVEIKDVGWWAELFSTNGVPSITIKKTDKSSWSEILRSIANFMEEHEQPIINQQQKQGE